MEKFIAGLVMGTALGALWVANSNKTRALVRKGQEDLKEKVDPYLDATLAASAAPAAGAAKTKPAQA